MACKICGLSVTKFFKRFIPPTLSRRWQGAMAKIGTGDSPRVAYTKRRDWMDWEGRKTFLPGMRRDN